jgi:hypothetical protein
MIIVAAAVVVVAGFVVFILSVPPYYSLKLTTAKVSDEWNYTSQGVPVQDQTGLSYDSNWRLTHWGLNFAAVSVLPRPSSVSLFSKFFFVFFKVKHALSLPVSSLLELMSRRASLSLECSFSQVMASATWKEVPHWEGGWSSLLLTLSSSHSPLDCGTIKPLWLDDGTGTVTL